MDFFYSIFLAHKKEMERLDQYGFEVSFQISSIQVDNRVGFLKKKKRGERKP